MSLAHELRVLELESQVELLERLQLLTNWLKPSHGGAMKRALAIHGYLRRYPENSPTEKISAAKLLSP